MKKIHHTHILQFTNDIQFTSNDVLRSLPSTVDKIDLFVIKTKLRHYWEWVIPENIHTLPRVA